MAEPWGQDRYNQPPTRLEKWVNRAKVGGQIVTKGGPQAFRAIDNRIGNLMGMQRVEGGPWYNRWEPAPYDGPAIGSQEYWKDIGKNAVFATSMAMGPVGGPTAAAARAARSMPTVRNLAQYAFARGFPVSAINQGIDTGNYAPAIADAVGWGTGLATARRVAPWVSRTIGQGGWFRNKAGQLVNVGAMIGGALAGWQGSSMATDALGMGSAYETPLTGARAFWNEDLVMGPEGAFIFDPPPGKYPEWDRARGRG